MKQPAPLAAALAAILVLVVAAVAVLPTATVADTAPPPEYTRQEDAASNLVNQIGTFSVTMYKLAHRVRMEYVRTSQCWSMPAGGGANYYWLALLATNGTGASGGYVATVWGIPGSESKTWKLLSFNTDY